MIELGCVVFTKVVDLDVSLPMSLVSPNLKLYSPLDWAKVELPGLSNDPMFTLGLDIVNGQIRFYGQHKSCT